MHLNINGVRCSYIPLSIQVSLDKHSQDLLVFHSTSSLITIMDMEDLLRQLKSADNTNDLVELFKKAKSAFRNSCGKRDSIQNRSSSSVSDASYEDEDYIGYVANSFVTLLLYYVNDFKVFHAATEALLALIECFPTLQSMLGKSGLFHNLMVLHYSYIITDRENEESIHHKLHMQECIINLYLALSYECEENIVNCMEVDLLNAVVQYIKNGKLNSSKSLGNGLKLMSFLTATEHQLKSLGNSTMVKQNCHFRKVWRQQCLVQEISWTYTSQKNVPDKLESSALSTILSIMNSFLIDSSDIQLYGLKCLISMLSVDGGFEMLWAGGAFDSVLHCCHHYFSRYEIQLEGFTLMKKLLCDLLYNNGYQMMPTESILLSKYEMVSDSISCALHTYSHSEEIMNCVCDIIKILILSSDELCKRLINDCIPKTLLQMLTLSIEELKSKQFSNSEHSNENFSDVFRNMLSSLSLFVTEMENCWQITRTLLNGGHGNIEVCCMLMLGTPFHRDDMECQSLLMSACLSSHICVVDCLLNAALLLTLHGYTTLNVENVKSCIRLISTSCDSVRNRVIVGVLLRFLLQQNDDLSTIDWKNLNISSLFPISLNVALHDKSKELPKYCGDCIAQGLALANEISNATWIPEGIKLLEANQIEEMFIDSVKELKARPKMKITNIPYSSSSSVTEVYCSCFKRKLKQKQTEEETANVPRKRCSSDVPFQDHLWISFDDSDADSHPCYSSVTSTQNKDSSSAGTGIVKTCPECKATSKLFGVSCYTGRFTGTEVDSCLDSFDDSTEMVRTFDISNNHLDSLLPLLLCPTSLLLLDHITALFVGHNNLGNFPCCLALAMENLTELKLQNNKLTEFPISVFLHCHNLLVLDLSHNVIEDLISNHDRYVGSRQFVFSRSHSDEITPWPRRSQSFTKSKSTESAFEVKFSLENLTNLNLSHNKLKSFPYMIIQGLMNLRNLDVSHNCIRKLKVYDNEIPVKDWMNLSHNDIEKLPHCFILASHNLKHLDISWNHISTCENDQQLGLGNENLVTNASLNKLNLSHNRLTQFPDSLLHLKRLKSLNVSFNQIGSFNNVMQAPIALIKDLDMSHNEVTDIEFFLKRVIGTWAHSLRSLRLNNNLIEILCSDIGLLRNLEVLELHENKITHLPNEIGRLNKLYMLTVKDNYLNVDPTVLSGRAQEIIGYFFSRLKQSEKHCAVRMNILGTASSGKDNFVKILLKTFDDFVESIDSDECGISRYDWTLKADSSDFQISVWNPELESSLLYDTHPELVICDRAMYVIIYGSDADVPLVVKSLLAVRAYASQSPVMLVVLHKDKQKEDFVLPIELSKMQTQPWCPHIVDHLHVNLMESNVSVASCFASSVMKILHDHKVKGVSMFGQLVPRSHIILEKILKSESKKIAEFPLLSYSSMIDLIRNQRDYVLELEDGEDLLSAVRYLTRSGVVWHQNDHRDNLRNNFILSPMWLLAMLEKVIVSICPLKEESQVTKSAFLIDRDLLKISLNSLVHSDANEHFPSTFPALLLRIMMNQYIVILISQNFYFAPCLLPLLPSENWVTHINAFESEDNAIRILCLDYKPVDFWHHLIARMLSFTKEILQLPTKVEDPQTTESTDAPSMPGIQITVLVTKAGCGNAILPSIMDHINVLVEEYFPTLLEPDIRGHPHFSQHVPCPICLKTRKNSIHCFSMPDICQVIEENATGRDSKSCLLQMQYLKMPCPYHTETSDDISELVCDVRVADFDENLALNPLYLIFNTNPSSVLGEGGFGTVFHGVYAGDDVAIKIFRASSSTPAYVNLRNELNIIGRFSHPSLISMTGYMVAHASYPTPFLVMELATKGSLSDYLSSLKKLSWKEASRRFPRVMRHRVAIQILDGLAFLHKNRIIFRDLKPDNVLIISLERRNPATVKLIDFGIAVPCIPAGTVGASGSPGYSAPEVVALKLKDKHGHCSTIPYTEKCDMFSYGLLLHEIGCGQSPWFMHSSTTTGSCVPPNIPDEAILKGILPPSLSILDNTLKWPHVQVFIQSCLQRNPNERPTAQELFDYMSKMEACCFRYSLDLGHVDSAVVRCIETQLCTNSTLEEGIDSAGMFQVLSSYSSKLVTVKSSPAQSSMTKFFTDFSTGDSLHEDNSYSPSHSTMNAVSLHGESQHTAQLISSMKCISYGASSLQIVTQRNCLLEKNPGKITCLLCLPDNLQKNFAASFSNTSQIAAAVSFWSLRASRGRNSCYVDVDNEGLILAGNDKGELVLWNSTKPATTICDLKNAIRCLALHSSYSQQTTSAGNLKNSLSTDYTLILVGLDDGNIVTFSLLQLLTGSSKRPQSNISLASCAGKFPVSRIVSQTEDIYATCGRHIVSMHVGYRGQLNIHGTRIAPKVSSANAKKLLFPVSFIGICHSHMYTAYESSSVLHVWNLKCAIPQSKVDVKTFFRNSLEQRELTITSLLTDVKRCVVYVGLNIGHVVILSGNCLTKSKDLKLITVLHGHIGPVWNITTVSGKRDDDDYLVTFGYGICSISFRRGTKDTPGRFEVLPSCIAVYDANMPVFKMDHDKITDMRRNMK